MLIYSEWHIAHLSLNMRIKRSFERISLDAAECFLQFVATRLISTLTECEFQRINIIDMRLTCKNCSALFVCQKYETRQYWWRLEMKICTNILDSATHSQIKIVQPSGPGPFEAKDTDASETSIVELLFLSDTNVLYPLMSTDSCGAKLRY